jgi:hypothetical protein
MLGVITTRNFFSENTTTVTAAFVAGTVGNLLDFIDSNTATIASSTGQEFDFTVSSTALSNLALVIDCIGGDDNCFVSITTSSIDTFNHVKLQNGANLILINAARTLSTVKVYIQPSRDLVVRHIWLGFVYEFSREPEASFDPEAYAMEFYDFRSRNGHLQMRDVRKVQKSLSMNFTHLRNTPLIQDLRTSFNSGFPFYFFFRPVVATPDATTDVTTLGFNGYLYRWTDSGLDIPFILGTHVSLSINARANYYPLVFGDIVSAPANQPSAYSKLRLASLIYRYSFTHAASLPSGYVMFGRINAAAPTGTPKDNSFYDTGLNSFVNAESAVVLYSGNSNQPIITFPSAGTWSWAMYSYNQIKNKIKYNRTSPLISGGAGDVIT